ncbi:hypothetical protein BHE74_00051573 [Ensete ventricosum]|nr:hypothetical protein GW17_00018451 [Ensete ventricosum]RWW42846.1 hypothetical protein BHE74_00051573 [Ensete ventricosum]
MQDQSCKLFVLSAFLFLSPTVSCQRSELILLSTCLHVLRFLPQQCSAGPNLLSLLFCSRAQVAGLRLISSPQMHLVVGFSSAVRITGLTITAPGDSLNTDGVHIEQSRDILIDTYRLVCVSSIGSLGMANSLAQVSDIQVDHCNVFSTMNGVRIKTWQASFPSSPLLQPKE